MGSALIPWFFGGDRFTTDETHQLPGGPSSRHLTTKHSKMSGDFESSRKWNLRHVLER